MHTKADPELGITPEDPIESSGDALKIFTMTPCGQPFNKTAQPPLHDAFTTSNPEAPGGHCAPASGLHKPMIIIIIKNFFIINGFVIGLSLKKLSVSKSYCLIFYI